MASQLSSTVAHDTLVVWFGYAYVQDTEGRHMGTHRSFLIMSKKFRFEKNGVGKIICQYRFSDGVQGSASDIL